MELKDIPADELLRELERRQFTEKKICYRWVCTTCGNEAVGGEAWKTSYVVSGRVWCKVCDPHRPDFYGTRGRQSVPMRLVTDTPIQTTEKPSAKQKAEVTKIMALADDWLLSWDVVGEGANIERPAIRRAARRRLKEAVTQLVCRTVPNV